MVAFERAISEGAHGIEFDVRLSRDGVPVVIHDSHLRRLGLRSELVSELMAEELRGCDVGSWFNRRFPALSQDVYANQCVPSLEEFFTFIQKHAGVFYLEMKPDRGRASELVLEVSNLIQQHQLQERIVVLSFDLGAVKAIKDRCPEVRTGALFQPRFFRTGSPMRKGAMIRSALACNADEIALHRLLVTPRLIEQARSASLEVVVWTVDDPAWLATARRLGIKAVITNNPQQMTGRNSSQRKSDRAAS
jgi:glycerophosphoryl diester phosphodiesterase